MTFVKIGPRAHPVGQRWGGGKFLFRPPHFQRGGAAKLQRGQNFQGPFFDTK
jgi:hypothetical protein